MASPRLPQNTTAHTSNVRHDEYAGHARRLAAVEQSEADEKAGDAEDERSSREDDRRGGEKRTS